MMAKPFIGALDGHSDGVWCTANAKNSLVQFFSGSCDGEIRAWDLAQKKTVWSVNAHRGFVRGLTVAPSGRTFYSCGDDAVVKQWSVEVAHNLQEQPEPLRTYVGKSVFHSIDHHWRDPKFVTTGSSAVDIWDCERTEPVHSYKWGVETVGCARYNPAEADLFASCGNDRSVALYDARAATPLRKVILQMRTNKVAWNPMEPFYFVAANEDHNLYTFDMRNMERAIVIHKDHVSAVMDVAFSPTGREFVSGSYDRTTRIFGYRSGKSREVYHTKRMHRIFCVNFSADSRFILTGSDDTNIRIWKARAAKPVAKMALREERKMAYRESLKKRFGHLPEIRRIANHRHLPKSVKKAKELKELQKNSERRKVENRKRHSKPGSIQERPEKKQAVVTEEK
uniref:Sof1-like protein domain-containing protein n=1 Tax=Heterosigma akashiwo TaxID=2829 RepID=A0A7S3XVY0_HETAK